MRRYEQMMIVRSGRSATLRPAFSLAEIMIAIGILGVGMLMVAATFPVGLDQSRIVAEKSRLPMIADEAFSRIEMLLNESIKRFPFPPTSSVVPPVYSFRDLVMKMPRSVSGGESAIVDRIKIPNTNNWLLVNDFLSASVSNKTYSQPAEQFAFGGLQTRFYPSLPGGLLNSESPYSWSVLLIRSPAFYAAAPTKPYPDQLTAVVFVNRKSTLSPVLIEGYVSPDSPWSGTAFRLLKSGNSYYVKAMKQDTAATTDPPTFMVDRTESSSIFDPGGYVVVAQDFPDPGNDSLVGQIYRIKSVELDQRSTNPDPRVELDVLPGTNLSRVTRLCLIPADPLTGHTPCIGVYSRRFPL